jgi:hypothetical protein
VPVDSASRKSTGLPCLNEISKQLDANMTQREGLADQYGKLVMDFNARPKRLKPAVR